MPERGNFVPDLCAGTRKLCAGTTLLISNDENRIVDKTEYEPSFAERIRRHYPQPNRNEDAWIKPTKLRQTSFELPLGCVSAYSQSSGASGSILHYVMNRWNLKILINFIIHKGDAPEQQPALSPAHHATTSSKEEQDTQLYLLKV